VSVRHKIVKRYPQVSYLSAALVLFGAAGTAFAADLENGRRVAERWCSECHVDAPAPGKARRAKSFATIAARQDISSEMIIAFLRLPHSTMPNRQLSAQDIQDLAALIMSMKK
jgi:mono/diheme cytochrome c family protein